VVYLGDVVRTRTGNCSLKFAFSDVDFSTGFSGVCFSLLAT
jgi:hypothetical protein